MSAHRSIIITGSKFVPGPSSLKTLLSRVEFPNGNTLLHQFVLDYSKPNNSCIQNLINAVLLSFPSTTPVNLRNRSGLTALALAIKKTDYVMVKRLISRFPSIDVNAKNAKSGKTCLHFAISLLKSKGDSSLPAETVQELTKIIELLISSGADLKSYDNLGASPLHVAVWADHLDTVKLLIEKGADVDYCFKYMKPQYTALHVAVKGKRVNIVKFLISKGAYMKKNVYGVGTVLHIAVRTGCLEIVKFLVEKGGIEHDYDNYEASPFRLAVSKRHIRVVQYLLDSFDLNACGYLPLHDAVKTNCLEVVELFIDRGAPVNVRNQDNETPLHVAVSLNQIEMAEFLIKRRGYVNAVDKNGNTPLHYAVKNLEMVKLLVKHNAVVNIKNSDGDTPLHYAAKHNYDAVVFLINHGADVNAVNKGGFCYLLSNKTLPK